MPVNNPYKRRLFTQPTTNNSLQSHEENKSSNQHETNNLQDGNTHCTPNELKIKRRRCLVMDLLHG